MNIENIILQMLVRKILPYVTMWNNPFMENNSSNE